MSYDYAYTKRWRLDVHRGVHRYVEATAVREHITMLLAAGGSKRAIADAAGISSTAVTQLVRHGQKHTQRSTARRILAVRVEDIQNRATGRGFVPATGTRRRIQALQTIGHTARTIGAAAGVSATVVHNITVQTGEWVSARNRDAILTAYDALWSRPGTNKKTVTMSHTKGWAPPLAWDDDTIEDPSAQPDPGHNGWSRPGRASGRGSDRGHRVAPGAPPADHRRTDRPTGWTRGFRGPARPREGPRQPSRPARSPERQRPTRSTRRCSMTTPTPRHRSAEVHPLAAPGRLLPKADDHTTRGAAMQVTVITTITTTIELSTMTPSHAVDIASDDPVPASFAHAVALGAVKSTLAELSPDPDRSEDPPEPQETTSEATPNMTGGQQDG